jgi:glycosyltransferase involved in cell wall biosynthesis
MRIAFVNDYSMQHVGGAVTSLLEQKRALQEAGHSVIVFQIGKKPKHPIYDTEGFIYIPGHFRLSDALSKQEFLKGTKHYDKKISEILKRYEIEVVHTQTELTLAYLVAHCAQQLSIPIVSTTHTFDWASDREMSTDFLVPVAQKLLESLLRKKFVDYHPEGSRLVKMLKNMTLNLVSQSAVVVSPSAHQKKEMLAVLPQLSVEVVPNPFKSQAQTTPKVVTSVPHIFRLVWVGRCVPEKRPLEFLKAVSLASKKTNIPFTVDIIGRGPLLKEMRRRYPLENVSYHGQISHSATVEAMDRADALFLSSYHFDNQPMVIAEALTRLRPVVYCDELLTEGVDIAGYLTKDETVASMTAAIVDLVTHPQKAVKLSMKAREAARLFESETYVETMTSLYKRATSRS